MRTAIAVCLSKCYFLISWKLFSFTFIELLLYMEKKKKKKRVLLEMRNLTHIQNCITVIAIILENYLKGFSNAFESITLTNMRRYFEYLRRYF